MIAKYLATSLAIENVVRAPRVISSCFPISTISISLVGSRVEVDHVAGFARRDRAGVHGHAHVGLRQRRRIVGAVAAHGDQLALGLFVADELQLVLGRGLGQEVVDPRLGRDRGGGHRVVARDHDGADAHAAQFGKAGADAALDDVLEVDDAEQPPIARHRQRRAACLGDLVGHGLDLADGFGAGGRLQRLHGAAQRRQRSPARSPSSGSRRPRPCGSRSRRHPRRSCGSGP